MDTATIPDPTLPYRPLYLLTLKCKRTSQFGLLLDEVRFFCSPHFEHRMVLADWDARARTISIVVTEAKGFHDVEYLVRDLTLHYPAEGQYNRVEDVRVLHITNDPNCLCTPCGEGFLTLEYFAP